MTIPLDAAERLDRPPPDDARAMFSAGFGRRFVIFGDAEEEFDWHKPFSRAETSTAAMLRLPKANRRFVERGVIPTYLVDYPVVDNEPSAEAVAEMVAAGECDVGTQLHPWVNPPFDETVSDFNSYAGNLPWTLERAKLHALTERIERAIGRRPAIYRAGRYGIGPNSASLLAEAGYRMDVSVRALFDYRAQHGPDFSRHPVHPWWIASGLLEVPLTTAYTGLLRAWPAVYRIRRLRGMLAASGMLSRIALTPEGTPLEDALAAIRNLLADGARLFSLSFHTPSIEVGHTPYVREQGDLDAFWRWWDGVFDLFAREGVLPARSGEILDAAC